jgi:hypothetical protein
MRGTGKGRISGADLATGRFEEFCRPERASAAQVGTEPETASPGAFDKGFFRYGLPLLLDCGLKCAAAIRKSGGHLVLTRQNLVRLRHLRARTTSSGGGADGPSRWPSGEPRMLP